MHSLEYIRENGCAIEKSFFDAVAQGMTDSTIDDDLHLILQRNFIYSKLCEAKNFGIRVVSLLESGAFHDEVPSEMTPEQARQSLINEVEKLQKVSAKKNLDFSRGRQQNHTRRALEKHFYSELIEPLELPNDKTVIINGKFTSEESFGRCIDVHENHTELLELLQNVQSNVALSAAEKERFDQLSYAYYVGNIETHTNVIPQRVKYGILTSTDHHTFTAEEQCYLKESFLTEYTSYLKKLADSLKNSHLKVLPLDLDSLVAESEKFGNLIVTSDEDVRPDTSISSESAPQVADIHAAEERVKFWAHVLRNRIHASTRMLERRKVISPEEIAREDYQREVAMRASIDSARVPSWGYVHREEEKNSIPSAISEINVDEKEKKMDSTIPLWLRKINGLNIKRFCQVCNQTYLGPTIFAQHFKEFRHSQCLSMIGIINVPAMHGVDTIEDAKLLWKKIIETGNRKKRFWTSGDMEFEDEFGEVYSKGSEQSIEAS